MPVTAPNAPVNSAPSFGFSSERPADLRHWGSVAIGSLLAHILLLLLALGAGQVPNTSRFGMQRIQVELQPRTVTRLIAPPPTSVLTQKAPNKRAVSEEFNVASLPPRPAQPNVPASPGAAAMPKQKFRMPGPQTAEAPRPSIDSPAPPAVDTAQLRSNTPPPAFGNPTQPPPPQIEAQEKPKLAFEKPGMTNGTSPVGGLGRTPVPKLNQTVDDTLKQVARGSGRGLVVGDEDASPGASPSSPSVPIPGKLGSAVELLSDPQGVDFWPYLVKVLSTVRRNWFAVIPESARFGRQGRATIQFAIARDGSVPKLVIATPSGAEALDRAAVAAISASNPFVPLPPEFKGSQIRLQFVFKYNVK